MGNTLHLEPEVVQELEQRMHAVAQKVQEASRLITSRAQSMAWTGPARDEFMQYMYDYEREQARAYEAIENLRQRLIRELNEWLETDNAFASSAQQGTTTKKTASTQRPPNAPKNGQELFKIFGEMGKKNEMLKIVRINENEFVVLLAGTDPWNPKSVVSARNSVYADESRLEKFLKENLPKEIPKGATLHFAGYSQGGYVALDLVNDKWFANSGFKRGQVVTFGAIPGALQQTRQDDLIYIDRQDFLYTSAAPFCFDGKQFKYVNLPDKLLHHGQYDEIEYNEVPTFLKNNTEWTEVSSAKWDELEDTSLLENASAYFEFRENVTRPAGEYVAEKAKAALWKPVDMTLSLGKFAAHKIHEFKEVAVTVVDRGYEILENGYHAFTETSEEIKEEIMTEMRGMYTKATEEASEVLDDLESFANTFKNKLPQMKWVDLPQCKL